MNYQKASETHSPSSFKKPKRPPGNGSGKSNGNGIQNFWNERIMERFIKANLFIICCVAAGLLLIVYLGAFSCEVSWLLEAHGELPIAAYTLCTLYFVMFVATTILIHGLVSGLCWPLFAWSVVIGLLSIPELVLVMLMTTQHWGLQSVHGLTELTSYLIRLIINCLALICVIPTGIKWRREMQVLNQLQGLATRLSLQTPAPSVPMTKADSRRSSQRLSGFENAGYQLCDETKLPLGTGLNNHHVNGAASLFGSQNEFNASMFAPALAQQFTNGNMMQAQRNSGGGGGGNNGSHRAQSLMDLRCTLPGMYNPRHVLDTEDKNAKYFNITIDDLKNNLQDSHKPSPPSLIGSTSNDPIYCATASRWRISMASTRCRTIWQRMATICCRTTRNSSNTIWPCCSTIHCSNKQRQQRPLDFIVDPPPAARREDTQCWLNRCSVAAPSSNCSTMAASAMPTMPILILRPTASCRWATNRTTIANTEMWLSRWHSLATLD
ncbi:hypothetical protein KR215_003928 [Drosophila sulfurigaster]|nr:hypothetical protein KR215_003928 [Drosophila sulfurigaster]